MTSRAGPAAEIMLCTASIAASLLGSLAISALPLAAAAALAARRRQMSAPRMKLEIEAVGFAEDLTSSYSKGGNMYVSLRQAAAGGRVFSGSLSRAVREYALGTGSPVSLGMMSAYGSRFLSDFCAVVRSGLSEGCDVTAGLEAELLRGREALSRMVRSEGRVGGFVSISRLGSSVFFPAFAGIGLGIMGFSGLSGSAAQINYASIAVVMFAYIIVSNWIVSLASARNACSAVDIVSHAALYTAIGTLVFKASSALAGIV